MSIKEPILGYSHEPLVNFKGISAPYDAKTSVMILEGMQVLAEEQMTLVATQRWDSSAPADFVAIIPPHQWTILGCTGEPLELPNGWTVHPLRSAIDRFPMKVFAVFRYSSLRLE